MKTLIYRSITKFDGTDVKGQKTEKIGIIELPVINVTLGTRRNFWTSAQPSPYIIDSPTTLLCVEIGGYKYIVTKECTPEYDYKVFIHYDNIATFPTSPNLYDKIEKTIFNNETDSILRTIILEIADMFCPGTLYKCMKNQCLICCCRKIKRKMCEQTTSLA